MEINTQQMEALLQLQEQQAQLPHRNGAQADGFEALLARQLDSASKETWTGQAPAPLAQSGIYNPIQMDSHAGGQESEDPDMAVLQAAFDEASGALDLWDSYASALGSARPGAGLRDAYSLLEDIDARVAQLGQNPMRGKNAALDAMLNELEILSAAEKFKFNRGDYI